MRKTSRIFFLISLCWLIAVPCQAVDLVSVYKDALGHDPIYQQAVAVYLENKEIKAQALSVLLPQVTGNARFSRENQTTLPHGNKTAAVRAYSLNLDQQLFNWNAFKQLSAANATVQQAAATLSATTQDLVIRVSQAYFNVLQAEDVLNYTKMQQQSVYKALQAVKTRYKVKHATITDVDQAQASYDTITARYYGTKINLQAQIEELSKITGISYHSFKNVKEPLPLLSPKPTEQLTWVNSALKHNLTLISSRFGIVAAQQQLKAEYGNFLPVVSAVGLYDKNNTPLLDGATPNITSKIIGINVGLPIITGGLRHSQVRAAKASLLNANALMQQAYLNAAANVKKSYTAIVIGINQVKEGRLAVKSNHRALSHTQEGYLAGTQTILDVLQQERQLFTAQAAYSRDKFQYLLNTLLLKEAAGSLKPSDLQQINKWLT